MCQTCKYHVCSGHVPVLLFAAHCICFRSDVLIIPEPARVSALLTHAGLKMDPADLNFTSPWAFAQTSPRPRPLHPNTLHVHLKTHMYSKTFTNDLMRSHACKSLSINNVVGGHVIEWQCDRNVDRACSSNKRGVLDLIVLELSTWHCLL